MTPAQNELFAKTSQYPETPIELVMACGIAHRIYSGRISLVLVMIAEYGHSSPVIGDIEILANGAKRLLIWRDEQSAENDDGSRAIAEIFIRA